LDGDGDCRFSALEGNKMSSSVLGVINGPSNPAEPKGISEEDLQNNFLPVFKMTAEGLEKLHSN